MKLLKYIFIFLLLIQFEVFSQKLVKGEYFFDIDPGIGNGIAIDFADQDTVELLNIEVDISELTTGYHKIFFRFMDENGLWSYNQQRLFYKGNLAGAGANKESAPLVKGEYFFNSDPGVGKGFKVDFTKGDTITLSDLNAPLDSLNGGYNKVFFRFMDENGLWSYNQQRLFFKGNLAGAGANQESAPLVKGEYFFNSDPGVGKGVKVDFTKGDTITLSDLNAPLDSLNGGYNKVFFRFMDENGLWSYNQQRLFFKGNLAGAEEPKAPLTKLEYFLGNSDPGLGNGVKISLGNIDSVNRRFINPVSGLALGAEKVFLRMQDSLGRWSMPRRQDFTVCTIDGPESGFYNIRFGNEVAFFDTSYNASKWRWDFGDGKIDSTVNPRHRYANSGFYTVRQIVENECGKDTLIKLVGVTGIQDIHPKKGGDIGNVTINVYGVGFADSTIVYLRDSTENGVVKIFPEITYIKQSTIIAEFNLKNQPIGHYDLKVEKLNDSNKPEDILYEIFEIISGIKPEIKYEIIGPPTARLGLFNNYRYKIENIGNIDLHGLTFTIYVNTSTDLVENFNIFDVRELSDYPDTLKSINYDDYILLDSLLGKPINLKAYSYYLPIVTANSTYYFDFGLRFNAGGNNQIFATTQKPLFGSPLQDWVGPCWAALIENVIGLKPEINCLYQSFNGGWEHGKLINELIENPDKLKSWSDLVIKPPYIYGKVLFDCVLGAIELADIPNKWIKLGKTFLDYGGPAAIDLVVNDCFDPKNWYNKPLEVSVINAWDPNEKFGTANVQNVNYIQSKTILPYTVMFENVDTATAAAQVVILYDTLDKQHLDLSTFKLTSFNFADRTFNVPPGLQNYSVDVDLRPEKNLIVRITGQLDTATGVAKWHYISFDPLTMALTDDPILGFLEPNVNPPEGDGRVTYSIKAKDSLANGTVIRNRAKIVFDANEPILTNEWKVTIDDAKPYSLVNELQSQIYDTSFSVSWGGVDPYGEISSYNIYVRINKGNYIPWLIGTSDTSAVFTGQYDSTYKFYSIAVDYAGNFEEAKTMHDAYTTIHELLPPNLIYPDSGSVLVNITPIFEWATSDYASAYHLQISENEDFTELLVDLDNIIGLSYQYTSQFAYETGYYWRMRSINGTYFSEWTEIYPFKTIAEPNNVPSHWSFKDSTGSESKVLIPLAIKPMVGGRQIAQGDAIGAFYTDNGTYVCAGYGVWHSNDMLLVVWGDDEDTPEKDGFANNEIYTFVVWDAQKKTETKATVEYASGPDNFSNNAESVLSKLFTFVTHEIPLEIGWNMISTYVEPDNTSLVAIFTEIGENTVLVKNNIGQIYYPEFEINDIGNWDVKQGYQVYMSQADILSITGIKIVPETTEIALSAGWNMLAYLRDNPMDIEIALAPLVADENLVIAKDNMGNVFYPAFEINMIGDMLPGQGYQIYLLNNGTLVYPEN